LATTHPKRLQRPLPKRSWISASVDDAPVGSDAVSVGVRRTAHRQCAALRNMVEAMRPAATAIATVIRP
jgi:hypothetical protein